MVAPVIRTQTHLNGTITVTKRCLLCGNLSDVTVDADDYRRWNEGKGPFIQNVMPGVSADDRETLLSGAHPQCFDLAFPEEEE